MGKLDDVPSGPVTEAERTGIESDFIVDAARSLIIGLRVAGVEPHQVGLILCSALVFVCDVQKNKRAALALCLDFLQQRMAELVPTGKEVQA